MTSYRATGLAEGFEQPKAKTKDKKELEILSAWQYLVDKGTAWNLQGWFGRQANALLEQGLIKPPKKTRTDYYGNKVNPKRWKK